jgi:hypothetical protein
MLHFAFCVLLFRVLIYLLKNYGTREKKEDYYGLLLQSLSGLFSADSTAAVLDFD